MVNALSITLGIILKNISGTGTLYAIGLGGLQ